MEINVHDDKKLVDIWLTRQERDNREVRKYLKPLYQEYAAKQYVVMFLPSLFHGVVGDAEWLFPGIPVELFRVGFKLSIIGNALEVGADGAYLVNSGLAFTLANLTAIFFGECINFPRPRRLCQ